MRRILILTVCAMTASAFAQERKPVKEAVLKKQTSATPDASLAGDIKRKKEEQAQAAPALSYDRFSRGVEIQVASKRREQIVNLKKIISLSAGDKKEAPALLFRLGELYWEEAKFFFFEANRKDDDLIAAVNRKDRAGAEKAKAQKAALLQQQKQYAKMALSQYETIVQKYKKFERMDEVLYFLGHNLMEAGEDRKSLLAYGRLIKKHPKSRYMPEAYFAHGEYYFNNSKGRREMLEKALENYRLAEKYPENDVYLFSIYKQGWCHFNLGDFDRAMDKFKSVVLFSELNPGGEKDAKNKNSLAKEARNDFVRAYAQVGAAQLAKARFAEVTQDEQQRFDMLKALANLYYNDGKDREAALTYQMLIKERPLSPEAPGFQSKIVDCVIRMPAKTAGDQKKRTVRQVRRLVKIVNEVEKAGVIKDAKEKELMADAKDLSERTLSNLAVTWHNEAKKTRDEETFEYANQIYREYLTLFPDNAKAYDLRFFWAELLNDNLAQYEKAAENYTLVMLQDVKRLEGVKDPKSGKVKRGKPGKWMNNAAYNAILAWDEVVKAADAKTDPAKTASTDITRKTKIPSARKGLLEACERYLKYIPTAEKRIDIAYKAAMIYYRHNHFDEAVFRFSEIALSAGDYKFENGERASEIAANLVLDSYNLLQDWVNLNKWARKFYGNAALAQGAFKDQLSKVIEQSSFKLVNQLESENQFAKAGEAYLAFVGEFPKSEIADQALWNASVDFYKAKLVDRAVQVRDRIIKDYPLSQFVPGCVYGNAEALELIGDFSEAAERYELYVDKFEQSRDRKIAEKKRGRKPAPSGKPQPKQIWEEEKAKVALFNAGVFREGLGQYKLALRHRERYVVMWPDGKDTEAVFLSIADLHEKMGAWYKAMNHLEAYERRYNRDPSKFLAAEGRIAKTYERLKKPRDVARLYGRILKYYDELPNRSKKALQPDAIEPVARAHFLAQEPQYQFYRSLRLTWGNQRDPNPNLFKRSVKDKAASLEQIQRIYTQTVQFKAADPAICALHRIGLAYDNMANTIENAPMHKRIPEEVQDELKLQFLQEAMPIKEKAAEAFAAAVEKSRELDIKNDCAVQSLKMLRETYKPDLYPTMPEDKATLKSVKVAALGGDIQTTITVPPAKVVDAAAQRAQAKALEKDLEALGEKVKDDPTPDRDEEPAGPAETPNNKTQPDSDEPEDFLE